ncbi:uncharacterized protein SCHCODRAFT_02672874 [Schizophyllum commune H4-8]|nr:uncharacterized protein SCHCODRAFT_02672874 [Schizophyllum commune H4-8]KAI5885770.1 hypothetical protein SCHCODRAFT_02672874 [Schizophyllum commune H4-8]
MIFPYLCRARFYTTPTPLANTGSSVYISTEGKKPGIYADYSTAKRNGNPFAQRLSSPAVGIIEWELHCRSEHGGHEQPPPLPTNWYGIRPWANWRRRVNDSGNSYVKVNEAELEEQLEALRRSVREQEMQDDPASFAPPPPEAPAVEPEDEEEGEGDDGNDDEEAYARAEARQLGRSYRAQRQDAADEGEDFGFPSISTARATAHRSVPSSPLKSSSAARASSARPAQRVPAVTTSARSPRPSPQPSSSKGSRRTFPAPAPIKASASALGAGINVSARIVTSAPGPSTSNTRARSSSPRKADRYVPTLPLYDEDSSEGEEARHEVARSFVVFAEGLRPRSYGSYSMANARVRELRGLGISAHCDIFENDEEAEEAIFAA